MIRSNVIKDCPVTAEDVRKAELIHGKDIGASKGKFTKAKNAPCVQDSMVPPRALVKTNRAVTLRVDAPFVDIAWSDKLCELCPQVLDPLA